MADFAAVVKELESQNKVLGDIKRNTAKPKKDAGDREVEKETAKRDGQTNVLLSSILGEIKGGALGKKTGGAKKDDGFSFGKLGLGAMALGGAIKAIWGFILNPFGALLKGGKWVLRKTLSGVGRGIGSIVKSISTGIGNALKKGWGLLKDFSAPKLKALGTSIKTLATNASNSIKAGLRAGWGFAKDMTMKAADIAKTGMNFLKDLGSKAMTGLKGGLQTAWGFAKAKGDKVGKIAVKLAKTGTKFLTDLGTKALGGLKTGLTNAWSTTVNLAKTGKDSLLNLAKNASTGISNAVSGLWQGAKDKSGKAISLAKQLAQSGISKATHGVGMLRNFAVSGANSVKAALTGVMGKITGIPAGGAAKKGAKGAAGAIAKTLLSGAKVGAKFIPGVGLAVTGAMALYDGFKAGFDTYKETGNFGQAVKDGAAGALSSLTFGLVSKETISSGFSAVGDKYTQLTTGVKNLATQAWTGVQNLIPTKEGMTKAWNAVGKTLAPLKDIVLPKEFSVEAVKKSLSSVGTALNASVKNMTGLDISGLLGKLPTLDDLKKILPQWLTDPIGWFRNWWSSGKTEAERTAARGEQLQNQTSERLEKEGFKKGALTDTQKELAESQKASMATMRRNYAEQDIKLDKKVGGMKGIGGDKKKIDEWLKSRGKGKYSKKREGLKMMEWAEKSGYLGTDRYNIQKLWAAHKLKAKADLMRKKKRSQKSGGSFSGFDPFIAHEGELIMPRQSSGLVLNRAATNAILSAGLNRLATANQGDTQGGGGSPTLINAPKVTNSTTTQTAMPIRRPLPIVQSMVG